MEEPRPVGIQQSGVSPARIAATPQRGPSDRLGAILLVGAAVVIAGSLMSWIHFTIGPLAYRGKTGVHGGIAFGTLWLGIFMAARGVFILRGTNPRGFGRRGFSVLFGPILVLLLLGQYAVTARQSLTNWVLNTNSAVLAQVNGVSQASVITKVRGWLDSGQSSFRLQAGFWITGAGAVVAMIGALLIVRRGRATPTTIPPVPTSDPLPPQPEDHSPAGEYVRKLATSLQAQGYVIEMQVPYPSGTFGLVASKGQKEVGKREVWCLISKLEAPSAEDLRVFARASYDWCVNRPRWSGGARGGMLLIPVALVTSPSGDLKEAVRTTRPARHATTWEIPALVDIATGAFWIYEKTPFIGAAGYRGFRKVAREILEPGARVVQ